MSSARGYALKLLKSRLRSAWEINQALLRKEVEPMEAAQIIQEFTELDLINDERYALAWVHTRDRLAPRGEHILRMELFKKGIPKEIIDKTLRNRKEEAQDEEQEQPTEEALARKLIEGKMRAYAHLDSETRNRRLISLLMRRGFSYEVARRILNA